MMKIHAVLLAVTAVLAASNANAEPFGGTRYIYSAPAGSYQAQQPVVATVEHFNDRGQDVVSAAPTGTGKPRTYADVQSQGFTERDSYIADSNHSYSTFIGWNN